MNFAIYTHADCSAHNNGPMHPENAGRLRAIMDALKNSDFADKLKFVDAPLADQADLLLAHPQSYIDFITSSAPTAGFANLDGY
jgi:acetoin utilization deacetylase AcuC-like enzyme